jgi:hypothetical protein
VWSYGPRTLTRVSDRHYTFGDEVVKHNGTAWEYYYERPDTGKVLIEIVTGNQAWPWLVPWVDFTAQKLCLPPVYPAYRGGDTIYYIGDRVSHGGGNYVCIYNAGSVGYGPFGGYLDGTANGIIYWLLESSAPSVIPVASTGRIIINDTATGINFTGTYQKESSTRYNKENDYNKLLFWDSNYWLLYDENESEVVLATPPANNINYIPTTGWPTQTFTAG